MSPEPTTPTREAEILKDCEALLKWHGDDPQWIRECRIARWVKQHLTSEPPIDCELRRVCIAAQARRPNPHRFSAYSDWCIAFADPLLKAAEQHLTSEPTASVPVPTQAQIERMVANCIRTYETDKANPEPGHVPPLGAYISKAILALLARSQDGRRG